MEKRYEDEARAFWEEKEKEKGGKVRFYTFATYYGRSGGRPSSLGGLLYLVKDRLYFEDFEKESWLLKIMNRKSTYEKTEFFINTPDITLSRVTSRGSALNCIEGFIEPENTKSVTGIVQWFVKPVLQISLKNGTAHFFEIMKMGRLLELLPQSASDS
jgi:hypothetical protein